MKLRELIDLMRLGAMLRAQAFGQSFKNGGSCALGAIEEAMGSRSSHLRFEDSPWYSTYLLFIAHKVRCPECNVLQTETSHGGFLIVHLNDDHRWSRDNIADWLETVAATIEPQEDPDEAVTEIHAAR